MRVVDLVTEAKDFVFQDEMISKDKIGLLLIH